jgi:hypothetical protein
MQLFIQCSLAVLAQLPDIFFSDDLTCRNNAVMQNIIKTMFRGSQTAQQIAALLIIILLVSLAWIWWLKSQPPDIHQLPHDSSCDLRAGGCETMLPDGSRVSFSIEPKTIPMLKPLQLKVIVRGYQVEGVRVDIRGVEMNMGNNQVTLNSVDKGIYTGEVSLSVCIRDVMEWEARVLLINRNKVFEVPFRFITEKGSGV